MQDTELKQNADFLGIAVECMEDGDGEVAAEFLEDVITTLDDDDYVRRLKRAREHLRNDRYEDAASKTDGVINSILEEVDDL